jgi:uncharacterized membrane protein YgdD (TMEM256/DUF423 family)
MCHKAKLAEFAPRWQVFRTMSRFAAFALGFAGLSGFAGVALGALAAHGFPPEKKALIETASQYALVHALAVAAAALTHDHVRGWSRRLFASAAVCFGLGVILFSGSLVALALNGKGGAAPVGGTAFLVGWALFSAAALASLRHHLVDQP